MSEKMIVKSVYAPKSTWEMVEEIGGGNASKGFRDAVSIAHSIWEKKQARKWAERAKAVAKKGDETR